MGKKAYVGIKSKARRFLYLCLAPAQLLVLILSQRFRYVCLAPTQVLALILSYLILQASPLSPFSSEIRPSRLSSPLDPAAKYSKPLQQKYSCYTVYVCLLMLATLVLAS